jgi:hypothetical protein
MSVDAETETKAFYKLFSQLKLSEPNHISEINHGLSHKLYRVATGKGEFIVKVFSPKHGNQIEIEKEFFKQYVPQLNTNMPEIVFIGRLSSVFEHGVIVSRKIDGLDLDIATEQKIIPESRAWALVDQYLLSLHNHKVNSYNKQLFDRTINLTSSIEQDIDLVGRYIGHIDERRAGELLKSVTLLSKTSFVNGDAVLRNFIYNKDVVTCVDWDNVQVSDKIQDYAWILYWNPGKRAFLEKLFRIKGDKPKTELFFLLFCIEHIKNGVFFSSTQNRDTITQNIISVGLLC